MLPSAKTTLLKAKLLWSHRFIMEASSPTSDGPGRSTYVNFRACKRYRSIHHSSRVEQFRKCGCRY